MKKTQRELNPYKNSDSNKRYYTYDYYLRRKYGSKVVKIPLDAGFTCPNIDGKCAVGGCIYCSGRGSGDFAASPSLDISEQLRIGVERMSAKWNTTKKIAYFQAHTNTYAPVSVLKEKYEAALSQEGVVGLNIATRADCLPDDVTEYLAFLSGRTELTVELGLQSVHDQTARLINRGHDYAEFLMGYEKLKKLGIACSVHLIFGLPGETQEMMLESVRRVAELMPEQVKLHLLYVIKGTRLGEMFLNGEYTPMNREEYIEVVCDALECLPEDTVIGRLTGDGAAESLLAPEWSRKKTTVINDIDKELFRRNSYQGKRFAKNNKVVMHL